MHKPKPEEPLELDGRTLEGGGQLIRIAFCLSALTGIPVRVDHIRGKRAGGGGLKAQHLACVQWLAEACNAQLSGAGKGSKTLLFTPGEIKGGLSPAFTKKALGDGRHAYECRLDIGTAGSTGLALQAILPFILFSNLPSDLPIHLRLSGGTNVSGSPSFEYIDQVLLPTLHRIGFPKIKATLGKRGWSQGGTSIGNFTLEIPHRSNNDPVVIPAFTYQPSEPYLPLEKPSNLHGIIIAPSTCHEAFVEAILSSIKHNFGDNFPLGTGNLRIQREDSQNEKRLYFILIATVPNDASSCSSHLLARDWLYDRKVHSHAKAAKDMAEVVTKALMEEWRSGAWVDEHMRDQLVIFQALAKGRSRVFPGWSADDEEEQRGPSLHARTAEWVAKQLLGVKFDAEGSCEGVAFGDEVETADKLASGIGQLELEG